MNETTKFVKQAYIDYTSPSPVTIQIFKDGETLPYYTTTLPARPQRAIIRVRFPAILLRTFRLIALCDSPVQMWSNPRLEWKAIQAGSSYQAFEVTT